MLILALIGCSDSGFVLRRHEPFPAEPDIEVHPAEVAFPPMALGCSSDTVVEIVNVGEGPLELDGTFLRGREDGLEDYSVEFLQDSLLPGDSANLVVQFAPTQIGDAGAELLVDSDDPDEPRLHVPISGQAFDPTWQLDMFDQTPDPIDVLWVIDNSGSMWQERDRVTTEISSFFKWFERMGLDYHMGVVTTDVVNPLYSGKLVGSPTYVTPESPDPEGQLAVAIDVGGLEMGNEAGLAAMQLALSEPLVSGYNAGFYRDEARLMVIFLSDEPDQSLPDADAYIAFLDTLKPERDDIFLAAIVGDRDRGCHGSCAGDPQDANPGNKYLDAAEAFNGFEESICTCDLAPAMERMGFEATWYVRSYALSNVPGRTDMLQVWVDGKHASGWSYDPDHNAVVFDSAPPLGSQIVVRYPVDLTCGG
jgi:hypothetical protein